MVAQRDGLFSKPADTSACCSNSSEKVVADRNKRVAIAAPIPVAAPERAKAPGEAHGFMNFHASQREAGVVSQVTAGGIPGAIAIAADVTLEEVVAALVERTIADFGALHVLVANAGIMSPSHPVIDTPLAEWRQTFSVTVDGVFLSIRYAAPAIIASGGGSIIAISSIAATAGSALQASYTRPRRRLSEVSPPRRREGCAIRACVSMLCFLASSTRPSWPRRYRSGKRPTGCLPEDSRPLSSGNSGACFSRRTSRRRLSSSRASSRL